MTKLREIEVFFSRGQIRAEIRWGPDSSVNTCNRLIVSEHRVRNVLRQHGATQQFGLRSAADQPFLVKRISEHAAERGRYGYRRRIAFALRRQVMRMTEA